MRIQLRSKNIEEVKELREALERQIRLALTRFDHHVVRVAVTLTDVNGPRGGVDKHCTLRISGRPGWRVVIRDRDSTTLGACNAALTRAIRAVDRRLDIVLKRDSRLRRPTWWTRHHGHPVTARGSAPADGGFR